MIRTQSIEFDKNQEQYTVQIQDRPYRLLSLKLEDGAARAEVVVRKPHPPFAFKVPVRSLPAAVREVLGR